MTFELFPAIRLSQMRVTRQGVGRGGRGMANWLCAPQRDQQPGAARGGWEVVLVRRCWVTGGGSGGSGGAGGW